MVDLQRPWWGVKIVPGPAPITGRPTSIYYDVVLSRAHTAGEWFATNRTVAKKLDAVEARMKRNGESLGEGQIGYMTVHFDHGTTFNKRRRAIG